MNNSKWSTWTITYQLNYCDPPDERTFKMNSQGVPSIQRMKDEVVTQHPKLECVIYSFKMISYQKTS